MSGATNRRDFLKQSALLAGLAAGGPALLAQEPKKDKLGVAVIGGGGMGGYSVGAALGQRFVALADVDDKKRDETMAKTVKDKATPKLYYDWRKMLEECEKDIDVVLIATPDHHHAPAAVRAMKMGKHVFCQKPMGQTIEECWHMAKVAKEQKVLTQMGNQGHCGESLRRTIEYVGAGVVGKIAECHALLGRNFGGGATAKNPAPSPVPDGLHWDEWLGPQPYREYHKGLHPFDWRNHRGFGTGTVGDMACHNVDCLFFALKVYEAKTFQMECLATKGGNDEFWPQSNVVLYTIPARGDFPELKAYVYDNAGLRPQVMKDVEKEFDLKFSEDTLFLGEKGRFYTTTHADRVRLLPLDAKWPDVPKTEKRCHGGPIEDLFYCIKNGGKPGSNFEDAGAPLTAFALAGHLAQFAGVGKKLTYDVEKMECAGEPELSKLVRKEYRKGWEIKI